MKTFTFTVATPRDIYRTFLNLMSLSDRLARLEELYLALKVSQADVNSELDKLRITAANEEFRRAAAIERLNADLGDINRHCERLELQKALGSAVDERLTRQGDRITDLEIRLKAAEASIPVGTHSWQKEDGADVYACKFCRKALEPNAQDFSLCMGKPKL